MVSWNFAKCWSPVSIFALPLFAVARIMASAMGWRLNVKIPFKFVRNEASEYCGLWAISAIMPSAVAFVVRQKIIANRESLMVSFRSLQSIKPIN